MVDKKRSLSLGVSVLEARNFNFHDPKKRLTCWIDSTPVTGGVYRDLHDEGTRQPPAPDPSTPNAPDSRMLHLLCLLLTKSHFSTQWLNSHQG